MVCAKRSDLITPHPSAAPTHFPQVEGTVRAKFLHQSRTITAWGDPSVSLRLTAPLTQGRQWGAPPPLCKGRWVGLGRAGGVVFSEVHLNFTDTYYASARPEGTKKASANGMPYTARRSVVKRKLSGFVSILEPGSCNKCIGSALIRH